MCQRHRRTIEFIAADGTRHDFTTYCTYIKITDEDGNVLSEWHENILQRLRRKASYIWADIRCKIHRR